MAEKHPNKPQKGQKTKGKQPFVHLRTHSAYSLLEGAIPVEGLVALTKKQKMPALALTDSNNLFGSLEFSLAAAEAGVQPIVGCVFHIEENTGSHDHASHQSTSQLVLLAKNEIGYGNLLKLQGEAFAACKDYHHATLSWQALEGFTEGLIALTGGPDGVLGLPIQNNQMKLAQQRLETLKHWFEDRLYIELMRHGEPSENVTEKPLIDLAYKHNIPLVATNDVYFATRDMHEAHDVLICIADGSYTSQEERRRLTPEYYFKSSKEMAALFADIPEAIANTHIIAQRCAVMAVSRDPMLPAFPTEEGRSQEEELKAVAEAGLEERLADHVYTEGLSEEEKKEAAKPYRERLDYELGVITRMDYAGYFLIVSDFIRWSKQENIPVGPGRGSGAGSVIAWALEITNLDPLRFGLLFERFLNPERVSMPDFDIDFCQERRDEVIHYVQQRYGEDKVAQIITFGKLQARAVLRDVGRVLQMPYSQVDRICKMIPFNPINPVMLADAIKMDPELQKERDTDEQVAKLLDIGLKLEGLYRHASTHAAGVVIGDRPLEELIPLYYDPRSDMPVTGYSMKYAEKAGLVKFDFLGLKTLTQIARTCDLLQGQGIEIDIDHIPLDDKPTYELLSQGATTGVFQMESSGMRDALRKMKPDTIEDIIALISLYRPGPMENIPTYIARKHGKEKPDYLHPMLEDTLKETFGVIIYQEQVMQIAQTLAGYTLGAADLLRRAMGKKIKSEMDAQRDLFVEGALNNGVTKSQASHIFELVAKFAGYGFNKSHAAAYAMIGYQTAYLKANYPVEFLTASMNIDIGDTDKIHVFLQEAKRCHIEVLPPDINHSSARFIPETLSSPKPDMRKRAIRYALGALKNVGLVAMEALIGEREQGGSFKNVFDLAARCDSKTVNKRQLESLAKAGAFDTLHENRKQLFDSATMLVRFSQAKQEERESQQENLFGGEGKIDISLPELHRTEDWEPRERLRLECESIGFYLSAHPLDAYKEEIKFLGIVSASELESRIKNQGATIHVAGVVSSATHRATNGRRFAYLQFSDPTGGMEISVFDEDLIARARDLIESPHPLVIKVEASKDEGGVRLFARDIVLLEDHLKQVQGTLTLFLEHTKQLNKLQQALETVKGGGTKIVLVVHSKNHMAVEIALPNAYQLTNALLSSLYAVEGVKKSA